MAIALNTEAEVTKLGVAKVLSYKHLKSLLSLLYTFSVNILLHVVDYWILDFHSLECYYLK